MTVNSNMDTKKPIDFFWPINIAFNQKDPHTILEYGVFSDGLYCRQNVFADKYITYKVDDIAGLPKGKEEMNPLSDCKIPFKFYEQTVKFFKYVIAKKGKMEAYVLYARKPDGKYFMYIPKQQVAGASVTYSLEDFHTDHPGCYIVCDFHSHQDMGAFFSGTDDADDKRNRFAGVIGKVSSLIPEWKLRFTAGKKKVDLPLDSIFADNEDYDETMNLDFEEAIKKLDERVAFNFANGSNNYKGNPAYSYYDQDGKNGYHNYYKDYGYYGNHGSSFKAGGITDDEEESWIEGIYSSDQSNASSPRNGVVIRCDKCGKFTNTSQGKRLRGNFMCNACISSEQDSEDTGVPFTGHNVYVPQKVQGKKNSKPTTIGEALLDHVISGKEEVKNISKLKAVANFLEELRG